jgi:hypothetical protein
MNKWQRILTILLLAQLALGVFVFWPRPAAGSGGQPLLGGLTADQITGLAITDEAGNVTKLAKQGDGWIAPEAGAYPADAAKVAPVLDKLIALKTGRLIAQTSQSHVQLQVADENFVRKIDITKADGTTQTVYLGSPAGGQAAHVRLAGQDNVYLGSGLASWEVDSSLLNWIDPIYVSFNAADLTGLTLENKNGEFALTRDAGGGWQLTGLGAGETVDQDKVNNLVNALTSLRMTKPLGKTEDAAWGMAAPSATVMLQVKDGEQVKSTTLTLGAQDPADNSYAAKSSDSEFYVRVAEFAAQDLVERDRTGFLPATPTPAETAAPLPLGTPAP